MNNRKFVPFVSGKRWFCCTLDYRLCHIHGTRGCSNGIFECAQGPCESSEFCTQKKLKIIMKI